MIIVNTPTDITATLTIGNEQVASDTYSARQYANIILKDEDFRTRYIGQASEDKYNQLVTLVKTMLDYGSKAQIRFDINTAWMISLTARASQSSLPLRYIYIIRLPMHSSMTKGGNVDKQRKI